MESCPVRDAHVGLDINGEHRENKHSEDRQIENVLMTLKCTQRSRNFNSKAINHTAVKVEEKESVGIPSELISRKAHVKS